MDEIVFDLLKPLDGIAIETANSRYFFLVTDPLNLCGLLTGGRVGEGAVEASLIAVMGVRNLETLPIGARAMFLMGSRYIRTSTITGLNQVGYAKRSRRRKATGGEFAGTREAE